jgi:hypothetical protein
MVTLASAPAGNELGDARFAPDHDPAGGSCAAAPQASHGADAALGRSRLTG